MRGNTNEAWFLVVLFFSFFLGLGAFYEQVCQPGRRRRIAFFASHSSIFILDVSSVIRLMLACVRAIYIYLLTDLASTQQPMQPRMYPAAML